MATNASDVLIETLIEWGVDTVFGIPGDGINGIIEALRQRQDKVKFIQVRHEEAAAFMACAYAKVTGRLGVCIATSGPGGIHLLNGLYDAKLDQQPVLAITGLQFHDLLRTETQQDVDLDKLFMDVALYNTRIMGAAHVENVVALACRTALTKRGVAHITMPVDLQEEPLEKKETSKRNILGHVSYAWASRCGLAPTEDLDKAAEILNAGKKVCILSGQGALQAGDQVEQVAELLAAPIGKPLLGKASVPDTSPYSMGSVGLLGTRPATEALEDCDTLLIIGSTFPYIESYPKPGQAKCVQIDIDAARIGLRYDVDVGLVGDSKRTLEALIPRLKRKEKRKFLEKAQKAKDKWWALMEERGTRPDSPMKPQVPAWELGKRLKDDAIFFADSGTIATWYARQIPVRKGQFCSLSGNLATMACGLPYAVAAQVAYPERQVCCLVGDGGLTMLVGELATAVKYDLPIKVIVFNNGTLGQIKWEQMVFLGNPEYVCDLQPVNFAKLAEGFGAKGMRCEDAEKMGVVLDEALAHDGPVVVDCVVDPHEPPMPPKIEPDDALKFAESLAKGTPQRGKIAKTILKDRIRELI